MVSPGFFAMLGTSASLGRTFNEADEQQESGPVAVISHEFWQGRRGKDKDVLGRTVTLQDKVYTVVGVLPRGFQYPEAVQDAEVMDRPESDGGSTDQPRYVLAEYRRTFAAGCLPRTGP